MDGEELGDDGVFVGGELFGDRLELGLEFGVGGLLGEGLGPVEGEVEVAAAMVPSLRPGERSFSRNLPVAASSVSARTLALETPKVSAMCSKEGARAKNSPRESQRR